MNSRVWGLALFGAGASWVGDLMCVYAARGHSIWLVAIAAVLFGAMAPVWYVMSRDAGGSFIQPAITWSYIATGLSIVAALVLEHHTGPKQWIAFGLVILAALIGK